MLRVAELSVIHIHGILACSVSVFSLFAYSISTSSSFPEDFLKSSYLLVVVIFFFFIRQRPESNKPATRRGERGGERERERKRLKWGSVARREELFPLLFYPTSRLPIRSLWNIISSRDVTRLQPCSSSSSSSISPVRIGRKERKIREEEAAALERCSRGRWVRIGQEGSMFFPSFLFSCRDTCNRDTCERNCERNKSKSETKRDAMSERSKKEEEQGRKKALDSVINVWLKGGIG